ncbi:hypothetical protein FNW52_04585 [Flavobacterium sp. ZT3R18]|uniref:hypothetical protein n=1 Tax=Flavobacterium sp. ZT3R18 TaxID=2594429 RepID=UPI001179E4CE|nr:hypothetical protein [Flavobacterium sp. ZT3R18]TRX37243.1 hypothetical protein FNW52_04585 [Flavobacterium sp. ZT3R18]
MKILTTPFRIVFIFALVLLISSTNVFSQVASKDFKNSVKFNATNMLLYDSSYQFSYERIIKENQSINVFVGYQEFPKLIVNLTGVEFDRKSKRSGYSLGADYRFYLGSINKYSAPRGVYLAPFVTYFNFNSSRVFSYTDPDTGVVDSADLKMKLNLFNVGGELGYQFVLWDRFVIDCVLFGPSITTYKYNVRVDGDISSLDDNELVQAVIEKMRDKFPNIGNLTGDEGIEKKGVQSVTAVGFRYNISIGYRF